MLAGLCDPGSRLADLCRLLWRHSQEAWTGHVQLAGAAGPAALLLHAGRIREIRRPDPMPLPLGELVWRRHLLPRWAIEEAAAAAATAIEPLGRQLVRRGLAEGTLRRLLRQQTLERFRALMDARPVLVGYFDGRHRSCPRRLAGQPVALAAALIYWAEHLPRWELAVWARKVEYVDSAPPWAHKGPRASRPGQTGRLSLGELLVAGRWAHLGRLWLSWVLTGPAPEQSPRDPAADRPVRQPPSLGSEPPDDPAGLRRWWHEVARRHHPDRGGSLETFLAYQRLYERARGATSAGPDVHESKGRQG